ncbi:MAG: hypothetical protein ABIG61_07020 [Planctomycetota bacterium]
MPKDQTHLVPTGSFIPDKHPCHKNRCRMPQEFADWTFLDFYRNFDWGLPVHIYDWCKFEHNNCEYTIEKTKKQISRMFLTPLGKIEHVDFVANDGSLCPVKHFIRHNDDWRTLRYVVENTKAVPNYSRIKEVLTGIGSLGVADIVIERSPFGKLVHEYAGFEAVAYQLSDDPGLIDDFLQLQTKLDLEIIALAADSPADIVLLSDHADEQLISPMWYARYCVPFYSEAEKILHSKGKIFSTHLDGNFKNLFEHVRRSGFDLLDGCTPAPMTNYEVEELSLALASNMKTYCGVPSIFFVQETYKDEICAFAMRIVNSLKGKVILNVGDVLPQNGDIYKVIELGKWATKR